MLSLLPCSTSLRSHKKKKHIFNKSLKYSMLPVSWNMEHFLNSATEEQIWKQAAGSHLE
jgi:hypothetical protein